MTCCTAFAWMIFRRYRHQSCNTLSGHGQTIYSLDTIHVCFLCGFLSIAMVAEEKAVIVRKISTYAWMHAHSVLISVNNIKPLSLCKKSVQSGWFSVRKKSSTHIMPLSIVKGLPGRLWGWKTRPTEDEWWETPLCGRNCFFKRRTRQIQRSGMLALI